MKGKYILKKIVIFEVDSLNCLCHHPCIVPLIGDSLSNEKSEVKIVPEFMPNGSLFDVFKSNPRPFWWTPTAKAISICGFGSDMEFAHSKCTIHRDLSPRNLLFDFDYHLRIDDFRSSRMYSSGSSMTQMASGAEYGVPELYTDDEYG
jgi:serine/threonine protein kinase